MEFDFGERTVPDVRLPHGYEFVPWNTSQLDRHAKTKFLSFRHEMDSEVFPCLGSFDGCRRLMEEIAGLRNFLSSATWLIRPAGSGAGQQPDCGTIQGLANGRDAGSRMSE